MVCRIDEQPCNVSYHWLNWRVLVQFICLNIKVITLYIVGYGSVRSANVLFFPSLFLFHSAFRHFSSSFSLSLSLSLYVCSNDMLCMWIFFLLLFRIFCSFGLDRFALKLCESLQPKSAYGEKCLAAAAACVQKIGFGRFLLLVAYFYISSMLFLFDCMSGEDFNAFIIGCVYGWCFFFLLLVNGSGCLFIKQSSSSTNVLWQHRGVCVCTARTNLTAQNRFIEFTECVRFFVNKWCIYFIINHYPNDTWYCKWPKSQSRRVFFPRSINKKKN